MLDENQDDVHTLSNYSKHLESKCASYKRLYKEAKEESALLAALKEEGLKVARVINDIDDDRKATEKVNKFEALIAARRLQSAAEDKEDNTSESEK